LHWLHPLRGRSVRRNPESCGNHGSRDAAVARRLSGLAEDFARLAASADADVRLSFGALRHHVLHGISPRTFGRFLAEGAVPAARLELRISERALIARDAVDLRCLGQLGVQIERAMPRPTCRPQLHAELSETPQVDRRRAR